MVVNPADSHPLSAHQAATADGGHREKHRHMALNDARLLCLPQRRDEPIRVVRHEHLAHGWQAPPAGFEGGDKTGGSAQPLPVGALRETLATLENAKKYGQTRLP